MHVSEPEHHTRELNLGLAGGGKRSRVLRLGRLGLLSGLLLVPVAMLSACGSSGSSAGAAGSSATAGSNSTGGSGTGAGGASGTAGAGQTTGGGSGAQSCTNVTACGGSVVGAWDVQSACLNVSGNLDGTAILLGCPTVPVTGSMHVTGTWTANADGTYVDGTTTTGSISFALAPACLTVSSTTVACDKIASAFSSVGWNSTVCSNATGQCLCTATTTQSGGIGMVSAAASTMGNYVTATNVLTTDDTQAISYCVAGGSTLTLTPQSTTPLVTGSVVLQKATAGTGGAGGGSGIGGAGGGSATAGAGGTSAGGIGGSGTGGTSTGGSGTGGTSTGGSGTGGGATSDLPCDIYAAASEKCVAAHSTVRALFRAYSGSLYQVRRASDNTTKDIGVLSVGGIADSSVQDSFCSGTSCVITRVYDQSGNGNFVEAEEPTSTVGGHAGQTASNATAESLTVGGHKVYSLYEKTSQAYWRNGSSSGMPLGSAPQGVYMVTSGKHFGSGCCYDYGNGETSRTYVPGPSMDSVNFSNCTIWGKGAGSGPWVMADLEDGLFSGATTGMNANNPTQTATYVTAVEKNNGTTAFAIRGGDATAGSLGTYYSGALPNGKNPMKKQGSIVLGSGGDCCYSNNTASQGTFYEGAIVSGYPSDATDEAVHLNIISAGYGK